ncbi:MAG: SGNH/GDSL hydrolase family protein, partial [Pseudomonadota bacterium]
IYFKIYLRQSIPTQQLQYIFTCIMLTRFIATILFICALFGHFDGEKFAGNSAQAVIGDLLSAINRGEGKDKLDKATDDRPAVKILFIGNSYTFYNDLPKLLESIAVSHKSAPYKIYSEQVTVGGATIKKHWEQKNAINKITNNQWNYVILQDQSTVMLHRKWARNSEIYIKKFVDLIRNNGNAGVILYATWPRRAGHEIYQNKKTPKGHNYNYMKKQVDQQYLKIARDNNVNILITSDIWGAAQQNNINVYQADGSHPTLYGSYLVALKLYKVLFPQEILNIDEIFIPRKLDKQKINLILQMMQ